MKFSKKDFKKKYKASKSKVKAKAKTKAKEEDVDESLLGLKPGGHSYTHNEIQTNTQKIPGDTSSDFETDIPQTSADFAAIAKMSTRYGPFGFNAGMPGGVGMREDDSLDEDDSIDEAARNNMRAMVQELLKQRTKESDFVSAEPQMTSPTNEPSLEQISSINLKNITSEFVKVLANSEADEAKIALAHVNSQIKQNV